ncbi:DegT/DnrJ/EryC1/StrS family aminotransferase [Caldithrix abyssi]|nr:DegT/DnrJ/EryC1/StrS family aminotransferase [Caldithrix abyssi]
MEKIIKQINNDSKETSSEFEKKIGNVLGQGKAISFASGRMGFYSLMKILRIGNGDEVIIQGHTCSVMPNAVWRTGATPIFSDIDSNTFGSSAVEIEKVISPRTKMIVAQHSFGIPCNIKPIINLAQSRGIFLLEDCAITQGSKINGIQVGNFGDAALFSIDHSKPLNAFIGGLIYTNNNELYEKLKNIQKTSNDLPAVRQEAIWKKFLFERKYYNPRKYGKSFFINKINKIIFREMDGYLMDDYGKMPSSTYPYPARLPSFLAQLALFELEYWEREKNKRRELLSAFLGLSELIGLTEFLPLSYFDNNLEIVPLRFVYTHSNAKEIKKRMSKYLDTNWFWFEKPIIVCNNPWDLGYEFGSCPISEQVGGKIINWPCVFSDSENVQLLKYFEKVHS